LLWDEKPEARKGKVGVHVLMGGKDAGEWDIYPEENAILIGT
jgi:CRISPR-associated endonuclease/helicase Cas3